MGHQLDLKLLRHSCDFHQLSFPNNFQSLSSLSHYLYIIIVSMSFNAVISLNHWVSRWFYSKISMVVVHGVLGWGSQLNLKSLRHSCDFHQLTFYNKIQTSSSLSHYILVLIICLSLYSVISWNHCVSRWFHFKILTIVVQGNVW